MPRLRHDYTETGVPNLMSPAGFSIAWSDYMSLAIEKLNALTVGMLSPKAPQGPNSSLRPSY